MSVFGILVHMYSVFYANNLYENGIFSKNILTSKSHLLLIFETKNDSTKFEFILIESIKVFSWRICVKCLYVICVCVL